MCQERVSFKIQQGQRVTIGKRLFLGYWLLTQELEHSENGSNKMVCEEYILLSLS